MTALRSGRGQSPRHSLRTSLVTLQIALSVLLLAGGLAFGRAVREAFTLDLGFNTTRTAILSLNPSLVRSRRADFAALQDRSLVELLAKPWVRAAGWAAVRPLSGSMRWHLDIPDYTPVDPTEMYVESNVVTPGYLEALEIPLRRGRLFGADDRQSSPRVGVVSESFAHKFFPGRDFFPGS